jgi:hypothetical protein
MCHMTLLNFSMCLSLYMCYMGVIVYIDCTEINFMHFFYKCIQNNLLFMMINLICLMT